MHYEFRGRNLQEAVQNAVGRRLLYKQQPPDREATRFYIWRTQRDGRVRSRHASRDGQIFQWTEPPKGGHPGEDYGCRCWAEPVELDLREEEIMDQALRNGPPLRDPDARNAEANRLALQEMEARRSRCNQSDWTIAVKAELLDQLAGIADRISGQIEAAREQLYDALANLGKDAIDVLISNLTGPLGRVAVAARRTGRIAQSYSRSNNSERVQLAKDIFPIVSLIQNAANAFRAQGELKELADSAEEVAEMAAQAESDLNDAFDAWLSDACAILPEIRERRATGE